MPEVFKMTNTNNIKIGEILVWRCSGTFLYNQLVEVIEILDNETIIFKILITVDKFAWRVGETGKASITYFRKVINKPDYLNDNTSTLQ